jgi:hypothetical protein
MSEWYDEVEPIVCGTYRLTPHAVETLTPAEIQTMCDGYDWVSDREWERAIFLRTSAEQAANILDYQYPHYRRARVIKVERRRRRSRRSA